MHISRTTTPQSQQYSAASAVLINEVLKGSISLGVAMYRLQTTMRSTNTKLPRTSSFAPWTWPWRRTFADVFSPDCWKLSIPAILYVFQNNLQYVAASNLDAATFQVTYQMKILTTAAFSVLLLRKQLSRLKWGALVLLAVGVGIVQIQSGDSHAKHTEGLTHMNPILGFLAVCAACFTSGLAGVYFEMVLKNSAADLWVRNVQLSLFSLIPALLPAIWENLPNVDSSPSSPSPSLIVAISSFPLRLLHNFSFWAWATVLTQVLGGLITALVIKHADNILKGFATSLSIVLSFIASVVLFEFAVTPTFLLGAIVVLIATWLYNRRETASSSHIPIAVVANGVDSSDSEDSPRARDRRDGGYENIKLHSFNKKNNDFSRSTEDVVDSVYPRTQSSSSNSQRRPQVDASPRGGKNTPIEIDESSLLGFDLDTKAQPTIEKAKALLTKLGLSPLSSPAPSRPHSPLPLPLIHTSHSSSSDQLPSPYLHPSPTLGGYTPHPIYTPPPSRPSSPSQVMMQVNQMVHLGVSTVSVGRTSSRATSQTGSGINSRDSSRSREERRWSGQNGNGIGNEIVRTSSESESNKDR